MSQLWLHPTSTAQWHALVNEAQQAAKTQLDETLESYLVFMLMRFMQQTRLAKSIVAIEFLESCLSNSQNARETLRDVGDQCLIFSGLFPHRAEKRRVKISYYVDVGRSAYHELSNQLTDSAGELYHHLAHSFVSVMDILHSMRELNADNEQLSPLRAYELWQDTGSQHALRTLQQSSERVFVMDDNTRPGDPRHKPN
jgi:hypothetical protein